MRSLHIIGILRVILTSTADHWPSNLWQPKSWGGFSGWSFRWIGPWKLSGGTICAPVWNSMRHIWSSPDWWQSAISIIERWLNLSIGLPQKFTRNLVPTSCAEPKIGGLIPYCGIAVEKIVCDVPLRGIDISLYHSAIKVQWAWTSPLKNDSSFDQECLSISQVAVLSCLYVIEIKKGLFLPSEIWICLRFLSATRMAKYLREEFSIISSKVA
jgi:hypothetical protein